MQAPETEETIDLREYIAIMRARKWSIILTVGVVIAVALAFSLQQTRMYTAEARLLVEPLPSSQEETLPAVVNLETERELVQSVTVAELVKKELGLDMPVDDLLGGLDVQVVTETEVLIVSYTSDDPAFSQQAANGFAQGYIDNRRNQALADISAAQDDVQQSITGVTRQLEDVGEQLDEIENPDPLATPDPNAEGSRTALESRQTTLLARLGVLQERFDSLSPSDTVRLGAGQVIGPATRPTSPSSPNLLRNALLAAFLGLVLGVGGVSAGLMLAQCAFPELFPSQGIRGTVRICCDSPLRGFETQSGTPATTLNGISLRRLDLLRLTCKGLLHRLSLRNIRTRPASQVTNG